jgi:hypothetical protein
MATKRSRGTGRHIDPDKLRVCLRRLRKDDLLQLLDRAVDLLPATRLSTLVENHLDPETLRPDGSSADALTLSIKAFRDASLGGEYYEEFAVNSKNFTRESRGTKTWIAECERLLECCVAPSSKGRAETREPFEMLFDLLRRIDAGDDTIVFFADEGGSWQVGVEWRLVFPAYFASLAQTTAPKEYASTAVALIDEFESYDRDRHLRAARAAGSTAQKKALRGA